MRTLYSVRLEGLAANPAAPADLLLLILERAEPRMRNALLRREGVPHAVHEAAARHPDPRTRRLVAASGHAPVAIRARLAADPDPAVRRAAASAPEQWTRADPLPRDVVERLAADSDPQVRDALNGHASLPGAVRAALAADPDPKVRLGALQSWPDPPDEVVDAALEDPDPAVRRLAMRLACHRRPEFAAPLLATGHASAVSTVPLDGDQARALCRDPSPAVRAAAAANPHLPPPLVRELAGDPAPEVRLAVSLRPELTEEQRAAIDYEVGPQDRFHPPEWLWPRLDDLALMRRFATSAHVGLRRLAAHSPHLPAGLVALLAADEDFVVRLLLSEHHPDPPGDLLPRGRPGVAVRHASGPRLPPELPQRGPRPAGPLRRPGGPRPGPARPRARPRGRRAAQPRRGPGGAVRGRPRRAPARAPPPGAPGRPGGRGQRRAQPRPPGGVDEADPLRRRDHLTRRGGRATRRRPPAPAGPRPLPDGEARDGAADDQALDLAGAFEDREDLRE